MTEKNNEMNTGTAEILKFASLEDLLSADIQELSAQDKGEFESKRLGTIPFTALSWDEVGEIRKACIKYVTKGKKMDMDIDDNRIAVMQILKAVDKDERSTFTFYDKRLLEKYKVVNAEKLVPLFFSAGEIQAFSKVVQEVSGLTEKDEDEDGDKDKDNFAKN